MSVCECECVCASVCVSECECKCECVCVSVSACVLYIPLHSCPAYNWGEPERAPNLATLLCNFSCLYYGTYVLPNILQF